LDVVTVPILPDEDTPVNANVLVLDNDPIVAETEFPLNVMANVSDTVPTLPDEDTPFVANVEFGISVPLVADTVLPVDANDLVLANDPTVADTELPVALTVMFDADETDNVPIVPDIEFPDIEVDIL
jgi:hypothetical protein